MTHSELDKLLRSANRAMVVADLVKVLARAIVVLGIALLTAVVIDAGLSLHRYGLAVLDTVLLALFVWMAWRIALVIVRGRFHARRVAVAVECRLKINDSRLINAVDLAEHAQTGASSALLNQAITQGQALAGTISDRDITDRAANRRQLKPAVIASALLVLAYLLMPGPFHAALPRLLSPWADHPPFTLVRFDVRTDPGTVYYARPATITARLSGPTLPGRAQIVFVDDGEKAQPLAMRPAAVPGNLATPPTPDGQATAIFSFPIDRAEQTRRFYIATPRGRSRLYTFSVDTSPQLERAHIIYDYPADTGRPDSTSAVSTEGVRAPAGTQVTIRVTSNVPLGGGELRLTPAGPSPERDIKPLALSPDPTDPKTASVDFTLSDPGRFELSLLGADGQPGLKTLTGQIEPVPELADVDDLSILKQGWASYQQPLNGLESQRHALLEKLKALQDMLRSGTRTAEQQHKDIRGLASALDRYTDQARGLIQSLHDRLAQEPPRPAQGAVKRILGSLIAGLESQAQAASALHTSLTRLLDDDNGDNRQAFSVNRQGFADLREPFSDDTLRQLVQSGQGPTPQRQTVGQRSTPPGEHDPSQAKAQAGNTTETIDAGSRQHQDSALVVLPGVPAEYRDQAQAYFKRIAEESR